MHAFNTRLKELHCNMSMLAMFLDPRYKSTVRTERFRIVQEEVGQQFTFDMSRML